MKNLNRVILGTLILLNYNSVFAQQSIQSAARLTNFAYHYVSNNNGSVPTGLNVGCLSNAFNPAWFYFSVCDTNESIKIQVSSANPFDTSKALIYGPFSDTVNVELQILNSPTPICRDLGFTQRTDFKPASNGVYYILLMTGINNQNYNIHGEVSSPSSDLFNESCSICYGGVRVLKQDLCLITLDSATQRNKLIWEKGDTTGIAGYKIVRENSIYNQFDSLSFIPASDFSTYIDMSANPSQRVWRYMISRIDVCNNQYDIESIYTQVYQMPFLQQGVSGINTINLAWTVGGAGGTCCFEPSTYIYRGSSSGILAAIDSLPGSSTVYTDINPLPGPNYYQIVYRKTSPCSPSARITANSYSELNSNIIGVMFTGINTLDAEKVFSIYPNPANNIITLEMKESYSDYSVSVFSIEGKVLVSMENLNKGEMQIPVGNLATGIYLLEVKNQNGSFFKKFTIR